MAPAVAVSVCSLLLLWVFYGALVMELGSYWDRSCLAWSAAPIRRCPGIEMVRCCRSICFVKGECCREYEIIAIWQLILMRLSGEPVYGFENCSVISSMSTPLRDIHKF